MSILKNKKTRSVILVLSFLAFLVLGSAIVDSNPFDFAYFIVIILTIGRYIYIQNHEEE